MPASSRRARVLRGRLRRPLVVPALITTLLSALLVSLSAPPSLAASGSLSLSPGGAAAAALPGTLRDGGTSATFVVPGTSSGGVALAVELRAQSGQGYRAKVWVAP